jgi:hypothetical protein
MPASGRGRIMEALGGVLGLAGLVGLGLGLFALFKPLPKLKLTNRKRAGLAGLGGFLLLALSGSMLPEEPAGNEDAGVSKAAASEKLVKPIAEIAPEVFQPITPAGMPKAYATWKVVGFERINSLRIAAAQAVAQNPKCDYVEVSELSTSRSTAPQNPIVFVDCRNGERFYIGEDDLEGPLATEGEKGARLSKTDAVLACEEALKRQLTVPLSLDRDLLNTSALQAETTGNWGVEFTFKSQNGLGAKVPHRARCTIDTDANVEMTIVE